MVSAKIAKDGLMLSLERRSIGLRMQQIPHATNSAIVLEGIKELVGELLICLKGA
jgi:hypothetical protein